MPAASQGTMNNVTLGGRDPRTGRPFAYYETIGGGMGARPGLDGLSGVHTHMSNTRNTPIEAIEHDLPLRIRQYALRHGSGGAGRWRGGDGAVRRIRFREAMTAAILSSHRRVPPYGMAGGASGAVGRNYVERAAGARVELEGCATTEVRAGDVFVIETPGGGGYGRN
jgi:N-methylhydantoinase B/oxoprolinase/acetone carboxylase alpha subunit